MGAEFAPATRLGRTGDHTVGLQSLLVHTARGWMVLPSDAAHFYANLHKESPFPIIFHVCDMLDDYRKLLKLADSPDHLVPGHDPLVCARCPAWRDGDTEIVRLHEALLKPL